MFVIKQTIAEKGTGKIAGVNYWGKELVYCSRKESLHRMKNYVFKTQLAAKREIGNINASEPYEFTDHSPIYDVTYEVIPYVA